MFTGNCSDLQMAGMSGTSPRGVCAHITRYHWPSPLPFLLTRPYLSPVLLVKYTVPRTQVNRWIRCSGGLPKLGRFTYLLTSPHFSRDHRVLALDTQGIIYQTEERGGRVEKSFSPNLLLLPSIGWIILSCLVLTPECFIFQKTAAQHGRSTDNCRQDRK